MDPISFSLLKRRSLISSTAVALAATAVGGHSASAAPQTYYNFNLNGSLWGNPFASNFSLDSERGLSYYNLNLTTELLRASISNNTPANWSELGFASSNFQGLALGAPIGKVETTLIGGNVVTYDAFGRQRVSSVFGLRASTPLSEKFRLNAAQLFTPSGSGKSLSSVGLNYFPAKKTQLGVELAQSGGGFGGLISAERVGKRLSLAASYRKVDSNFSSGANPNLILERNGLFASAHYVVARPLTFDVQHRNYRSLFGGHAYSDDFSLTYSQKNRPTVTLFTRSQDTRSLGIEPGFSSGLSFKGQSTGVQVSHSFGSSFLTLGYDKFKFDFSSPTSSSVIGFPSSSNSTNRFNAGLVHLLNRQTQLALQYTLALGTNNAINGDQRSSFGAVDVRRIINNKGLSVSLGFDNQTSSFVGEASKALAARIGASIPVGSNGSIGFLLRTQVASSGSQRSLLPDTLFLTFSRSIRVGKELTPSRISALGLSAQERHRLGKITGRVFEDQNGNGRWDANEPGIPDVEMTLPGQKLVTSDGGLFTFADLPPSTYDLGLTMKTLPVELASLQPSQAKTIVPTGKSVTIDFPVMRTGQIEGVVFNDANRNGQQDEGEPGIENAIVRVDNSDTVAFSDKQGKFILYSLAPKNWNISVDTEAMTQGIREFGATGKSSVSVDVKPNGSVTGLSLGVVEKEREVVIEPLPLTYVRPTPAVPTAVAQTGTSTEIASAPVESKVTPTASVAATPSVAVPTDTSTDTVAAPVGKTGVASVATVTSAPIVPPVGAVTQSHALMAPKAPALTVRRTALPNRGSEQLNGGGQLKKIPTALEGGARTASRRAPKGKLSKTVLRRPYLASLAMESPGPGTPAL